MASTLLYLKSKTLLPVQQEEEKELTEEELLRRIIEYKKYKEITKLLKEYYECYSKRTYKLPDVVSLPKQELDKENMTDDFLKLTNQGKIEKENIELKAQLQSMLNSNSWKITAPLRKISAILRKII